MGRAAGDTVAGADPPAGPLAGQGAQCRFLTADDGVRLHYLHWASGRSPPWAVVIFLHGIASHAGWFAETAAHLNHHGVAVYGPDRRGSGRSGGPRGHLTRYQRALDDVEQLVRLVASDQRGTPVFLAASSWAAKLAVVYAAERPAPLSGLLLLGPGLTSEVKLSPARQVQVVVGHLVAPMAYLPIPLTPELYTANPPYQADISADPATTAAEVSAERPPLGADPAPSSAYAQRSGAEGLTKRARAERLYADLSANGAPVSAGQLAAAAGLSASYARALVAQFQTQPPAAMQHNGRPSSLPTMAELVEPRVSF